MIPADARPRPQPASVREREPAAGPNGALTCAYIAVGSNLGDRHRIIAAALADLHAPPDVSLVRRSSLHETAPVGGPPGQRWYLNGVVEVLTTLGPRRLLDRLLDIETRHGRVRTQPGAPRTLDLDLLLYGDAALDEPGLILPHPRMWQREFVLGPLAELCDVAALRARHGNPSCSST